MFHPPAPPPHYLPPPPPPHHAPVHPRHYPSTPLQHHEPPPHQYPPSPHRSHYSQSPGHPPQPPPHNLPPRHAYPQPPSYAHTPRPYNPPPSHRFPQAGPSFQPQYPNPLPRSNLPPAPHSAPARMDLVQWFDNEGENSGPGDFMFNFEQPSPTPQNGQSGNNILPRMTTSQSSTSLGGYIAQGPAASPSSANIVPYSWGPKEGWGGSQICIKVDVNSAALISTGNNPDRLCIAVGQHILHTNNRQLPGGNCRFQGGQIRIMNAVMPEHGTGLDYQQGLSLPVYIHVLDGQNQVAEKVHVGDWTFLMTQPSQSMLGGHHLVKREGNHLDDDRMHPRWTEHRRAASITGSNASVMTAVPFDQQTMYMTAPSPAMNGWGQSPFGQGPMLPALAGFPHQIALTPCLQPQLMRSSQLPASSHMNLYDAPKAEVHIGGDMNTMAKGWAAEEWACKRRLVKVWRRQEGANIFLAFGPLPQIDWSAEKDCVVVSCMFREDKNSCWITSVDMLYLLEAVIGTRFSVEEKNRIRRNLEGFRPQTVSKNKPSSDAFFRTIMGFPQPKPRNIEKDVKVFPWETVAPSLKKIVSKYTATIDEQGQPILYHPPSGEAGATIALPNVRDDYPRPAVTYNQSSVFTPPTQQSALPQVPQIPIDPSLLDIPGNMLQMHQGQQAPSMHQGQQAPSMHQGQQAPSMHQGQQAPSMHQGQQATSVHPGSGSMHSGPGPMQPSGPSPETGAQSVPMANGTQQTGQYWDATMNKFRSYSSPPAPTSRAPGLSTSHSSLNTLESQFPASPSYGYYDSAPPPAVGCTVTSNAPMLNSEKHVASPLDAQGQSQPQLEVNVQANDASGSHDPLPSWYDQAHYDLNQAPVQSFDDFKPPLDMNGAYTSNESFVEQALYTSKE